MTFWRRKPVLLALIAVVAVIAATVVYITQRDSTTYASPEDASGDAAAHFLNTYVEPDGRVVRHDEGGDTVSEGQAYGMLIAVAVGDQARFDSMWSWTRNNLMQQNGLLAWKWKDGKVVDPQPASDADIDAARALGLASTRFANPKYADDARVLARAVADFEVFYPHDGQPVLMAGPWATHVPYIVNPSYHSPKAEQQLAVLTTDTRWPSIEIRMRKVINDLLGPDKKANLPPDWAQLDPSGSIKPSGRPADLSGLAAYSYDAVRVPVRLAESCNVDDRAQAARLWPVLGRSTAAQGSVEFSLDGTITRKSQSAVGAVASAAAAHAAGNIDDRDRLLDLADRIESDNSTYYGAAWAALGHIMLTTTWLGGCA